MGTATSVTTHVFGPVPSRRLGRSLGIDLVPLKTCTYDCIYCQLGRTTCKTIERKEWVSLERVLDELKPKLATKPDYITLSGSGEPTLFTPLDKVIDAIRSLTSVPIAVLTNGSLLGNEAVQKELRKADIVLPSLDAGDDETFQRINRPHEGISFEQMLDGLVKFRERFRGRYWLEVLLLRGATSSERRLADIRRCIARIRPERTQLNTVTRPAAERYAVAVSRERLQKIAATFDPPAEVIAEFRPPFRLEAGQSSRAEILQMLLRRACTIDDIVVGLGMHCVEVVKDVEQLGMEGLIEERRLSDKIFYRAAPEQGCTRVAGFAGEDGGSVRVTLTDYENFDSQRQRRNGKDHGGDQPGMGGCRSWPRCGLFRL